MPAARMGSTGINHRKRRIQAVETIASSIVPSP
jgi:hypothetical protein